MVSEVYVGLAKDGDEHLRTGTVLTHDQLFALRSEMGTRRTPTSQSYMMFYYGGC